MTSFYVGKYASIHHIDSSNNNPDLPGFIANVGWKWSFYTQAALLVPMSMGFLFMPQKYLDIAGASIYRAKCGLMVQKKLSKSITQDDEQSQPKPSELAFDDKS